MLWDNPAVTTISSTPDGAASGGSRVLQWSSEYGKAIDYYFCYGDGTIGTAMTAYRHLTGEAPLMPSGSLASGSARSATPHRRNLLGVATKLRELKVPIDGIIQDWQYWPPGNNTWGSHQFDPQRYPDPAAHVQAAR